ncbi:MAG: NADP-dependent oxidoreductase [Deltaproteobacteria bacterium]|jgi:NADPH-dependent curcumin reductase CurA|nr:NADP-dependent oxidoreductase [Deltaproteobacteria bacterium]
MKHHMNQQWRLVSRPVGLIKESDFQWTEETLPVPGDGELLIRIIYLSLDPAIRGWVNDVKSYMPPVALGEVMRGIALGVVEQSRHPKFKTGDLVQGLLGWQTHALSDGMGLARLPREGVPDLTAYLGLLSMVGPTAYFGLLDVGKPRAGDTLVVSAAAGAVGSVVGQIGKIKGCRVVGIAGSDEKCRWITETLGFDAAINYKTEDVRGQLKRHCPQGVDVFFDNVGGAILDSVLTRINVKARIVICGLISQYNAQKPVPGPYYFSTILTQRAKVQGFVFGDYLDRIQEAVADLKKWLAQGKIQFRVHVVEGLEKAPQAVNMLFDGSNKGKLMVKVSEEP